MEASPMTEPAWRRLLRQPPPWVCVLPALLLVPFLDKAFNVDETQFLIYARLIAERPANPFPQPFIWDSMRATIGLFPHPLLWHYVLAAVGSLSRSEAAMRLPSLAVAVVGLWSLQGLARRLGAPPLAACALLAGSSVFLVMGSTVTPDLAAASLATAAVGLAVRFVDGPHRERDGPAPAGGGGEWLLGVLAGLAATAAFLCRYSALWIVPVLGAYALFRRRWRGLLPVAVALAGIAAWELWSASASGAPHFLTSVARWSRPVRRATLALFGGALLVNLGAQLPPTGLALYALAARGRAAAARAALALALALGLAFLAAGGRPTFVPVALLFAWPAMAVMVECGRYLAVAARRRLLAAGPEEALRWMLACWVLPATFTTVRYEHTAAKYVMLPLPAVILLVLDALRQLEGRRARVGAALLPASAAAGIALGVAVALSDARWAGMYRDFFRGPHLSSLPAPGRQAYFNADWGFRHYAAEAGLVHYHGQRLSKGDRLFVSDLVIRGWPPAGEPRRLVAQHHLSYPGPFALLSMRHGAGFYSAAWGPYPFVPTRLVRDAVHVFEK